MEMPGPRFERTQKTGPEKDARARLAGRIVLPPFRPSPSQKVLSDSQKNDEKSFLAHNVLRGGARGYALRDNHLRRGTSGHFETGGSSGGLVFKAIDRRYVNVSKISGSRKKAKTAWNCEKKLFRKPSLLAGFGAEAWPAVRAWSQSQLPKSCPRVEMPTDSSRAVMPGDPSVCPSCNYAAGQVFKYFHKVT